MAYNMGIKQHNDIIAVPISLKAHFEDPSEGEKFNGTRVVYFDPGDPGHDFLNPDADSGQKGILARLSAALRHGR